MTPAPDPTICFITVTFNSATELERCWNGYDPAWGEWLVVDNASADESVQVARRLGAGVIPLSANIGFSAANNIGARFAQADALIFCNPDVVVDGQGARRLARIALETGALVAPQLVNPDGTVQENGRGAPYPFRKLRHMFWSGHDYRYLRIAPAGQLRPVVWAMGAAVAVSRTTFDAVGGWNPSYFIYYEDAEISLRALRRGFETVVDGGTRWIHEWARATARGFGRSAWKHEIRSGLRFYVTHPYVVIPLGASGRRLRHRDALARWAV